MTARDEISRTRPSWPWWRWTVMGLSLLGLALSVYLSWHALLGAAIGCGGGSSCDQILSSRWSTIGGVLPVSGLAVGTYLAILLAGLAIGPGVSSPVRKLAWRVILVLASAAAGSAVWFTIVQRWLVRAFCPYCMAAHFTGVVLAILVIWQAPKQMQGPGDVPPTRPRIARYPVIGFVLAGILAACQVGIAPPPAYRSGVSQPPSRPTDVDLHGVPMVGSPDAKHVVTLLFDYNCPHCQKLHFLLSEVVRRYDGELAFTLRPAPLCTRCNPFVLRDVDEYKTSCELARIGLSVWSARREEFPTFDNWMFSLESGDHWKPRGPDAARAKAAELVGQAQFDAAQANPWTERYLQDSIRLYGGAGGNAIPKLIYGSRWVVPQPNDADDLVRILQETLAVPRP